MGAGGRRAGRGLKRAPAGAGEVSSHEPRFLVPALGLFFAATLGAAAIAIDQLVAQVQGPWINVLGAALVCAALVSTWVLVRAGWRRHREGLDRRAAVWLTGAVAMVLVGVIVVYVLVQAASFNAVISGADVHLTQPVLHALPRPPGSTLIDERPGLAGTESITDDFSANDLAKVVPFYATNLAKDGWTEDASTAGTAVVRFSKEPYVVTLALDQLTGDGFFAVTVDHLLPSPSASASASTSPSP